MSRSELKLIAELKYAPYFLTVRDIVHHARYTLRILCQGRGSAANSMVCYCLEITEVEPNLGNLVFGRFLSTERNEPPDIDVDFEHERREEVMQYIYNKYGRMRAGLTATVISYRSKSALREVAKVFGLSTDTVDALNNMTWGWHTREIDAKQVEGLGFDPTDATLQRVLELSEELMGFPRHLSQHVGGFILTRDRLDHLVPISNAAMDDRTVVEWDKGDIEALGLLKVDILALGMLSCIRRSFDLLEEHYGFRPTLDGLMRDQDDRVYKMTHRADTIGVFQIESRAQMSMLPRLKPKVFYDLVIEVAIVRPGPIQGGMVHPYLKRRARARKGDLSFKGTRGRSQPAPWASRSSRNRRCRSLSLAPAFPPAKADSLRRSMATFKRTGGVGKFREEFLKGMKDKGYPDEFRRILLPPDRGLRFLRFPREAMPPHSLS